METRRLGLLQRLIAALVLISLFAWGQTGHASAGSIIYVKAGANGAHTGATWADAYTNLPQALGAAVSGDQIWIAKGTYRPTSGTNRSLSFTLKDGVAVYGGFAGTPGTEGDISQQKPALNPTILSGDIGVVGIVTDNTYHVVFAQDVTATSILDGFTITGGYANGNPGTDYWGAGIKNVTGNPTLRNLTFTGNKSSYAGGAIYNDHGAPRISNAIFSSNTAQYGGAIYNVSGNAVLTNVIFSGNRAIGGSGLGGAINIDTSNVRLTNVTFSGNFAGSGGGALFVGGGGSPILVNVTFSGNSANSTGGAIQNNGSSPVITNATFSNNTAAAAGGHMYSLSSSNPSIVNSIFDAGGKIANDATSSAIVAHGIVQGGCGTVAGLSCSSVSPANPILEPLQNNGGFTATMALGVGSPAIDTGFAAACPVRDQRGVARPQGTGCDLGAYEVRALSFRSQGINDGWVLEKSMGGNQGSITNSTTPTLLVGDDASNRRYRSILSFDTSGLSKPPVPPTIVIVRARLMLLKQAIVGNPTGTGGNLVADLADPYFGLQLGLVSSDWSAPANFLSSSLNPSFQPPFAAIGSGWYSGTLNQSWLGRHIDKKQTTQFRLRLPKENNNGAADYFSFYSGNATTVANRPVLWVYYNP